MKLTGSSKLLPKNHTGKVRHHRHTSYGALTLVLLLTFIPIMLASRSVAFAATTGGGDYGVYGVVVGKPPLAPTINNLKDGAAYTSSAPITISGSCTTDSLVKIFKNEILAGVALCQKGAYQINVDLFIGTNSIIARSYNANDTPGPDSPAIGVQLTLPGTKLTGTNYEQLYITSEAYYRGATAGQELSWPLTVAGGQAPYAVSISWGDGKSDLISRGDANPFTISHTYDKAAGARGSYPVVIKATDQASNTSYFHMIALVTGTPAPGLVGGVTGGYSNSPIVKLAWQGLGIAAIVVVSFWLGELREVKLLRTRNV